MRRYALSTVGLPPLTSATFIATAGGGGSLNTSPPGCQGRWPGRRQQYPYATTSGQFNCRPVNPYNPLGIKHVFNWFYEEMKAAP
jgi:hypothetical protein